MKNLDTYKEVIDKCLDDTSTNTMEDCVNDNLYYTDKKYLNKVNQIGIYEEGEETKDIENKGVIHIYIAKN